MLCDYCNKKIKISDIIIGKCKCKKTFCILHRLGEIHNCIYNYKSEINKDLIMKNKCVSEKIIKI